MKSVIRSLQYVCLALAFSPFCQATTFANRPIADVVKEAPAIVRGQAGESYSDSEPSNPNRIYTFTKLNITESLKGDLKENSEILLRQPGGSKGGFEMVVSGAASFKQGDDVVVLLGARNDDGSYDVKNLTAGKYNVVRGDNGEPFVENSLGGEAMYDPNRDPGTLSYTSRLPLEVFRRIAKGEDIPEASRSQYQGSEKAAPHDHGAPLPKVTSPVPVTSPAQPSDVAPAVSDQSEKSGAWIPISFGIIALLGAVIVWRSRSKKGS